MTVTYYAEGFPHIGRLDWHVTRSDCGHCGQRAFLHAEDGRCYTFLEREAALRFHQQHQRWPAGFVRPKAPA